MTATEAYQILNVGPGVSQAEIDQAYRAALQTLQLQLAVGQPMAVRQKAQIEIAELKSAFEFLKNRATPGIQPTWGSGRPQPQARPASVPQMQPVVGFPVQPANPPRAQTVVGFPAQSYGTIPAQSPAGSPAQSTTMMPRPFGPGAISPTYPWVVPAGFIVAVAVMLFIAALCVLSSREQETARLRVQSVPWSYVRVDGKSLGPSGQLEAFTLAPGEHEVILRQGDHVITRTIHLRENFETVIEAQLERGEIHVEQK